MNDTQTIIKETILKYPHLLNDDIHKMGENEYVAHFYRKYNLSVVSFGLMYNFKNIIDQFNEKMFMTQFGVEGQGVGSKFVLQLGVDKHIIFRLAGQNELELFGPDIIAKFDDVPSILEQLSLFEKGKQKPVGFNYFAQ